ncbi:MAG: chorismate-binding protein [Bdellovibrionales bacterium]|nr:chorismate-binding protein [Bdellovibrionales bacterium]
MLEEARQARNNLAWLRDSQHKKALHVLGKRPEPSPGRLAFFSPDFALSEAEPWLVGEEIPWPEPWPTELPPLRHRVEPSAADFNRLHEDILRRIDVGEFEKVVPIVCEELEYASVLQPSMFPRVFSQLENQYSYGFAFGQEGLVGVTPELLFSVRAGVLQTMALAGTGPVDGPSLLQDPKERREHELVIQHIVGELSLWGRPKVGETVERVFGVLKHLYTPIHLQLQTQPTFMDVVVRLHPTAALGGWPRRPAVEWLERQKFHTARGRFGAPFGFQDADGSMVCVVAIRGLQWTGRRALLSSGCGVVKGSQALREWNELALKRNSVNRNLGLRI